MSLFNSHVSSLGGLGHLPSLIPDGLLLLGGSLGSSSFDILILISHLLGHAGWFLLESEGEVRGISEPIQMFDEFCFFCRA